MFVMGQPTYCLLYSVRLLLYKLTAIGRIVMLFLKVVLHEEFIFVEDKRQKVLEIKFFHGIAIL
jgi:hypothetical protein